MYKIKYFLFFYLVFFLFALNMIESQTRHQGENKYSKLNSKLIYNTNNGTLSENGIVDSVVYKTIDRYNDLRTHKETYEYNANSKLYFIFDEIWEPVSNKWINYSKDSTSFDDDGNIVQELGQLWSDGEWENWWKNEYTFNSNGQKKTWQYYNWLLFSGWAKGVKETYFYDDSGQLILKDAVNSGFKAWKDSLIYNDEGLLSVYFAQDWQDEQWINDWREIYSYNNLNQEIEILREMWQDGEWSNDWRKIYNYDTENNLILIEHRSWSNSDEWINSERTNYKYSEENNLVFGKHEIFDGENWIEENGLLEFNDKNGNRFYYPRETEIIVHYDGITHKEDVETFKERFILEQNFPNPFNPITIINYSIPYPSSVTFKVFDILGSEVGTLVNKKQPQGNYEIKFDGSNLTSGIYFYRLQAGDFAEMKKMILLK